MFLFTNDSESISTSQFNSSDISSLQNSSAFNGIGVTPISLSINQDGGLSSATGLPTSAVHVVTGGGSAGASSSSSSSNQLNQTNRPFFGDAFYSFQNLYWPFHCVICLVICTIGIFANVTNIIVLTRANMITAVNTILSAMAFSDLVVNISNIPYLMHSLGDSTNQTSFFSYPWAIYTLFHAHTTVTAHTISIWLTCVLATWRYCVVCRSSQPSNQRNWSVDWAHKAILAVFMIVPIFCIPNYLSFSIISEKEPGNATIYRVGFSEMANQSQLIKTFHFWIFSCVTKLVPCILLTFFTTALIRTLLNARERRLRLVSHDKSAQPGDGKARRGLSIPNGGGQADMFKLSQKNTEEEILILLKERVKPQEEIEEERNRNNSGIVNNKYPEDELITNERRRSMVMRPDDVLQPQDSSFNRVDLPRTKSPMRGAMMTATTFLPNSHQSGSECATEAEMLAMSSNSITSETTKSSTQHQQQPRILSQLIVESTTNSTTNTTTISTTMAPTKVLASSNNSPNTNYQERPSESARSFSTSGVLDMSSHSGRQQMHHLNLDTDKVANSESQPLVEKTGSQIISMDSGYDQQLHNNMNNRRSLGANILSVGMAGSASNLMSAEKLSDLRSSETTVYGTKRGRSSVASCGLAVPMVGTSNNNVSNNSSNNVANSNQLVKLHAAQRQLSQNETTTRLLIAVMIVFLICESPAGILAALCAIFGESFFENVYQPTGILTDLLALINSSVNFILYCFMSTQFRITFYQVVLRCPAPRKPQHHQAIMTTTPNPQKNHQKY